jgi:hypothetical protein
VCLLWQHGRPVRGRLSGQFAWTCLIGSDFTIVPFHSPIIIIIFIIIIIMIIIMIIIIIAYQCRISGGRSPPGSSAGCGFANVPRSHCAVQESACTQQAR